MQTFKTRSLLVATLLLISAGALGAEGLRTWQECFDRAVSNNLSLSIARLKLKEAAAVLASQESVYYPDVSARASRGVSGSKTGGDDNWDNGESLTAALSAGYTIFDGFGNRARVTQSEAELYAEKANFDQTCSNLEYDLRRAFADQLYAQQLTELLRSIAARRAGNVRLVEMRYEGGREHMGSLLLKRAQLTEALVATEEAERSLELARRRLAALMNETDPGSFLLQGDLRAEEPPPARELALNELARRTPSYRSAEADIKAAEQGFLIARSERFPTISASAALSLSGENDIRKEGWEAGLSISLPLFTGGQLSQDILAAGLRREQTRLTAERTMLDLMNTLHAAFNTWCDRHAAIRVQAAQLEAAEMRAAVARAQYEQGLISFQEWDTIENQLITSQRNWLSSLRAADQAQAAWQNALGGSALQQEPGL